MLDFVNIDDSKTVSLEEYLDSRKEFSNYCALELVFDSVLHAMTRSQFDTGTDIAVPDIHVKLTAVPSAGANPLGMIILTEGIIDYCMDLSIPSISTILGDTDFPVLDSVYLAITGMAWIVGHEYAHIYRAHNKVLELLEDKIYVKRALEYDADLVAVASVFRQLQFLVGNTITDMQLRQHAIHYIYWVIRTLPDAKEAEGVHPPFSERFFQIVMKLMTLRANDLETYDPDALRPETLERVSVLIKTALACEKVYLAMHGDASGDYLAEWQAYVELNGHTQIINDWILVSPHVETCSGTIADMARQGPFQSR